MTEKELKKLNRQELLEMLVNQMEENNRLQKELDEANEKLMDRNIAIENAGSLAEACLALNDVFKAADAAAAQYLENVKKKSKKKKDK